MADRDGPTIHRLQVSARSLAPTYTRAVLTVSVHAREQERCSALEHRLTTAQVEIMRLTNEVEEVQYLKAGGAASGRTATRLTRSRDGRRSGRSWTKCIRPRTKRCSSTFTP